MIIAGGWKYVDEIAFRNAIDNHILLGLYFDALYGSHLLTVIRMVT